jgi:prepilin-type N-terminal cleavage/methylation domain-containing protein
MTKPKQTGGFTLVEIMIVVAIIAILATIAVPAWLRASMRSQNAKFLNDARVFAHAMDVFATENKVYPPDFGTGSLTKTANGTFYDLRPYVDEEKYYSRTPLGGQWDIESQTTDDPGGLLPAAVGVDNYAVTQGQLLMLEEQYDDEDLTTGGLRLVDSDTRYYWIIDRDGI